jgi:hypothetical protein
MRRNSPRFFASIAGFAIAAILLAAGGLLMWGSAYVHNTVHGQLSAQQIYFPAKGSPALASPQIGPYLNQYAGEQLVTGQQAEAYADHFIAVHLSEAAGGQTYAQLSTAAQAQPNNTKLAGQVATVFKGETLRGILLNAYGWWKVSQITYIASIVGFALGGLALAGATFGLAFGRKTQPAEVITHESLTPTEAA